MSDLPRLVGQTKPGVVSPVEVWRKGKAVKLNVTVTELKAERTAEAPASKEKPAVSQNVVLGMSIVAVSPEARKKLRIKVGVQVTAVAAPASTVGIAEGDIVLAANNTDITSPEQFAKVIAGLDKTKPVGLMVRTGDQTRWVAVPPAK